MQRLSIQKGHAFILVYSVCSRQSLEELRPIWALIKEIKAETLSSIPVMLGMITSICGHNLKFYSEFFKNLEEFFVQNFVS
jgi:hypothetical protein